MSFRDVVEVKGHLGPICCAHANAAKHFKGRFLSLPISDQI